MRTTLKLVLPLVISVICIAALYAAYQVRTERRNLLNDLARNSSTVAENLQREITEANPPANAKASTRLLQHIAERAGHHEHLIGVGIYDQDGKALALTPGLDPLFTTRPQAASRADRQNTGASESFVTGDVPTYVYALPLRSET